MAGVTQTMVVESEGLGPEGGGSPARARSLDADGQGSVRVPAHTQWLAEWLVLALLAAATIAVRLLGGPRTIDDAYITFRYVQHLVAGQGFVYNPGAHVLGTTTPGYTLLLAALALLTHAALPLLSLIVAALCDGCSALLVWALVRGAGAGRTAGLVAGLIFAITPTSVYYAQSGMETSAFTLLLLLCTWRYVAGDAVGWGLAGGLAALVRPEALVFLAFFALWDLLHTRRLPWRALAFAAVPTLPWLAWATWYFGSPVPLSLLTKATLHLNNAGGHLTDAFATHLGALVAGPAHVGVGYVALVEAAVVTYLGVGRTAPRLRPALLSIALLLAGWISAGLRGNLIFGWYLVPLVPFALAALLIAGVTLLDRARTALRLRVPLWPVVLLLGAALLVAQIQGGGLHHSGASGWVSAPDYQLTARESGYVRACGWLAPRLGPRTVIAAPEIGAVGYFCDARILDTVGLVTPGMGRYNARNPAGGGVPLALILDRRPDYVVALGVFVRETLLPHAAFWRAYRQAALIDDPAWGSSGLYVFARRAIPGY